MLLKSKLSIEESRAKVVVSLQGGAQDQCVVLGPQYVVHGQPMLLILTEKKISMGTDSDVVNQTGQVMFKFDGKALSLKDKRILYDGHRNQLATMTQKVMIPHASCFMVTSSRLDFHGTCQEDPDYWQLM